MLTPKEDLFELELEAPGPVERFIPKKPEEEDAWRLVEGTGSKVGVAGREAGVRIELGVVFPAERRDCGRRIPVLLCGALALPI